MLCQLSIRDFIIVDHLELVFGAGFGVLTGETGAGKSILLDALALALGGRADATLVRPEQRRAEICAEFDFPEDGGLRDWLQEQELPVEEASVLLRRVLESNGRSRGWINAVPVTLTQLRQAGEFLLDIHGQHAHQALLHSEAQCALLDGLAGALDQAQAVARCYRHWRQLSEQRQVAEQDSTASEQERELLCWQLQELELLAFDTAQWEQLNQDHARAAHAASLLEGAAAALTELDEGALGVCPRLQSLCRRLETMSSVDANLDEIHQMLSEAAIQADEARQGLRRYHERFEFDPARLAEIEQRIDAVTALARKYRSSPENLPQLEQQWRQQLAQLQAHADVNRLAQLEAVAKRAYEDAAAQLSVLRRSAAMQLSQQVTEAMQTLAMAGGCFEVMLLPQTDATAHGLETVEFRVAANPSQPPRALAKVASGGELSRIGLAIQVIASKQTQTPTLIFDEVDAGIGGRVAEIVGQRLHQLGRDRQVLCVTHLPQVAACADWQWNVAKQQQGETVLSSVQQLDQAARIEEIARMLGGVKITATTRQHAAEMLAVAATRD